VNLKQLWRVKTDLTVNQKLTNREVQSTGQNLQEVVQTVIYRCLWLHNLRAALPPALRHTPLGRALSAVRIAMSGRRAELIDGRGPVVARNAGATRSRIPNVA